MESKHKYLIEIQSSAKPLRGENSEMKVSNGERKLQLHIWTLMREECFTDYISVIA